MIAIYGDRKDDTQNYGIANYGICGQKLRSNLIKIKQLVLNLAITPWYFERRKVSNGPVS